MTQTSYAVHPNDQTSELKVRVWLSSRISSGAIHRTAPWVVLVVLPVGPIISSMTWDSPKSVRTARQVSVMRTLFWRLDVRRKKNCVPAGGYSPPSNHHAQLGESRYASNSALEQYHESCASKLMSLTFVGATVKIITSIFLSAVGFFFKYSLAFPFWYHSRTIAYLQISGYWAEH
jgi:hypothetical protein